MYDTSNLNQEFLFSLKISYLNFVLLAFIIYFCLRLLASLNYSYPLITLHFLGFVSVPILIIFYLETYQFVYLLNSFSEPL